MSTTWILIFFFKYGYGVGTSTAVFADRVSCQVAAEWINRDVKDWAQQAKAACFPAGR